MPKGFFAYIEQKTGMVQPDVLALDARPSRSGRRGPGGGLATLPVPTARYRYKSAKEIYAAKANRIVIKKELGRTVAVIELVSPGNKDSRAAYRDFLDKVVEFVQRGVHVLLVDVFPPTPRDPGGVHRAVWEEIGGTDDEGGSSPEFAFPPGQDRTLVSYVAGREKVAYVEPVGVGDALPDMPAFLTEDFYVMVPLEAAYAESWGVTPEPLRTAVETGKLPALDEEEEGEE
jgi:hypothetical protein